MSSRPKRRAQRVIAHKRSFAIEVLESRQLLATNIGAVRPDTGSPNQLLQYLLDSGNLTGTISSSPELNFRFGLSAGSTGSDGTNDESIVGDWGRLGFDQAGSVRNNGGLRQFWLDTDRDTDQEYLFRFGQTDDTVLVGNFDGLFGDDIAVVRNSGGFKLWEVRYASSDLTNAFPRDDSTVSAQAQFVFGLATDKVQVGDFNNDGRADLAAVRNVSGNLTWIIHYATGSDYPTTAGTGLSPDATFVFGQNGDIPVVGNWDNSGSENYGVVRESVSVGVASTWLLDTDFDSTANITQTFGLAGDRYIVGQWATRTWDGGASTTSWNDAANWSDNALPGLNDTILIDQPNSNSILVNNGIVNIGAIFSHEPVSVTSGGALLINQTSDMGAVGVNGGEITLRAPINASGFSMSSGTTYLEASSPLGGLGLDFGGGSLVVPASFDRTLSNNINLSGTVSFGGAGILRLTGSLVGSGNFQKTGANFLQLSGTANTYTGSTTISQGELLLGGANRIPDASAVSVVSGTLNMAGFSDTVGALSGTSSGSIVLNGATLTTSSNTDSTFSGVISTSGTFVKQGSGVLTFGNANTYTGATHIQGGELKVGFVNAMSDNSDVNIGSGAVFNVNGFNERVAALGGTGEVALGVGGQIKTNASVTSSFFGSITGVGNIVKDGTASWTLYGSNTFTGDISLNGGTLLLGNSNVIPDGSNLTVQAGATFDMNNQSETLAALTGAGSVVLGSGTLTLNISNTPTIGPSITGAGGIVKAGTGTATIDATKAYTGATTVAAGTLIVNTSLTNSSGVSVASGATLKGSGSVNATTVSGTIAPGNSPGILYTGNLSLAAGSTFEAEIGGMTPGKISASHDQISVNGTVTIAPTASLNVIAFGGFVPYSNNALVLIQNDGSDPISGIFSGMPEGYVLTNFLGSGQSRTLTYVGGDGNDLALIVSPATSVPRIGDLDNDFGVNGIGLAYPANSANDVAQASVVQSDGKLIVAGVSNNDFAIARFNTDGSLDTSFGGGDGIAIIDLGDQDTPYAVAVDGSGRIVLGGTTRNADGSYYRFGLARLTSVGALDTTFGSGGIVTTDVFTEDIIRDIEVSDTKITVAGYAYSNATGYNFALARYSDNGSLDSGFGVGGIRTFQIGTQSALARSLSIKSNGDIIVAGETYDGDYDAVVARVTSAGSLDTTFGTSGYRIVTIDANFHDGVQAVALQSNDAIVFTGTVNNDTSGTTTDLIVGRLTATGALDTTFGTNGVTRVDFNSSSDWGKSLAVQSDNRIVVAGYTGSNSNGSNNVALWRFTTTGALDTNFGTAGLVQTDLSSRNDIAVGVSIDSSNRFVVGSESYAQDGRRRFAALRYVDFVAPLVSYIDDGASSTDGLISDGTFTVTYNGAYTWEYSSNGGANWTTGTGNTFTLGTGTYVAGQIRVRQIDASGNRSSQFQNSNTIIINSAPVLSGIEGATLSYTENETVVVSSSLNASDANDTHLESATVSITTGLVTAEDFLAATTTGTSISAAYSSATGILTLTGSDTLARYQIVLRSVTYTNLSENPNSATRTVSFKVNDGDNDSNVLTRNIAITPVDDAAVVIVSGGLVTISDPDTDTAADLTASIVSGKLRITSNTTPTVGAGTGTIVINSQTVEVTTAATSLTAASFQLGNLSDQLNISGNVTVPVRAADTSDLEKVVILSGGTLTASGILKAAIEGQTGSAIVTAGDAEIGDGSNTGFVSDGSMLVNNPHTLTLRDGNGIVLPVDTTVIAGGRFYSRNNADVHFLSTLPTGRTLQGDGASVTSTTITGGSLLGGLLFDASVTLNSGLVAPGTSTNPQRLWVNNLHFNGGTLEIGIAGNAGIAVAGGNDAIRVDNGVLDGQQGSVNLNGTDLTIVPIGTPTINPGDSYVIINNFGNDAISGTLGRFASYPEGAVYSTNFLGSGLTARVTYVGGDGNDVAIVVDGPTQVALQSGNLTISDALTHAANNLRLLLTTVNSVEYVKVETLSGTAITGIGTGVRNVGIAPTLPSYVLVPKANITGKITLQLQNGTSSDFDQLTISNGVDLPITAATGEVDWIGVESGGTLRVDESLPSASTVVIRSGGQVKGAGTVGSTTVYGTVAPGNSPGILNTGNLNLFADSVFQAEIGGTTPGNTNSSHDQIAVTGSVAISKSALFNPTAFNSFTPSVGNSFVLISNDGTDAITGNFKDLPEGTLLTNFLNSGLSFLVTYVGGDGNDFAIYSPLTLSYLDTGTSSTDGITTEGKVTISGLTGQPWQYSVNGGTSWTTGTGSSFVLAAGSYESGKIRVRQTNAGSVTAYGQINSRVFVDKIAQGVTELFASGKQQGELQGIAVAVSSKYRVVGSSQTDIQFASETGSVLVYDSNNVLLYRLINPSASFADGFGTAVAISGDYIVVGAESDSTANNSDVGTVYVYDMRSGTPTVPIATLSNPTPANSDGFGFSVAADGNYVVVGAPKDDAGATDSGAVYVFDLSSATPSTPVYTLINPAAAAGDAFGYSVAISGNRVAVGAYLDDTSVADAGNVMIYDLTSGTPTTPIYTLTGASPVFNDQFGYSVAMSGNYVVVGVDGRDTGATNAGAVYVYDLTSGTPTVPVQTINNPSPAGSDLFGISVAISGTKIVIGAHQDDMGATDAGSAYVYDLLSGTPTSPVATLNNPAPNASDFFGFAVSIAGNLVAVGAYRDDTVTTDAGSTYLYDLNSGTPSVPVATFSSPSNNLDDRFGIGVAASGNYVLVGSTLDDTGGFNTGTVFVYDRSSPTPNSPVLVLTNPTPASSDSFGYSIAIDGNYAVVSAPFDDTGATNAGSVYVYNLTSGTPTVPVWTMNNPSPGIDDGFGWSVSISGNNLIVGTDQDDAVATNSGSAYIYSLTSGTPTVPIATLTNPSPAVNDVFGRSVAISDRYAVVGALGDDASFADSGLAYVYDLTSGTLNVPVLSLSNPTPAGDDQYGFSVAVLGNTVAVTSLHDGTGGYQAGTIYLYNMAAGTPGTPATVINNPNPGFGESFGWSLAMSDDLLVVGARQQFGAETSSAAHVYDLSSSTKTTPIASLHNPNPSVIGQGDIFAHSVAIAGNTVIAGAAFEDTAGVEQGAAYLFNITGNNSASLDGSGNLTIGDNYSSGKANTISVTTNGSNVVLTDTVDRFSEAPASGVLSNGRRTLSIPVSSVSGRLVIASGTGDDTVTIDFTNGNPIPAGGVEFNGGTGGNDALRIIGGTTTTVSHTLSNANDGTIVLGGALAGSISYTGLEPIIDNLNATDRVFTFSNADDLITLSTGTTLHNIIDSNFAESVEFNNPANSLTINAGGGNDSITITSIHAGFAGDVTIDGGTGDDSVNFNTSISFASGKSLDVNLQNDDASPGVDSITINANADLVFAGTGSATLKASKNIALASGASIVTANGNISLEANQQSTPSSGNFVGVGLDNALIQVTGSGTLSILGKGGTDSSGSQFGVQVKNGADIITASAFGMSVTGRGGLSTGISNYGISIVGSGSTISSSNGPITLTGFGGGTGASSNNSGVDLDTNGALTASGTGVITVTGTGGSTDGGANRGVSLNTAQITSSLSKVTVTGTGGGTAATPGNQGIQATSATITSGTNADLELYGYGGIGTRDYGVWINGTSTVSSGGGQTKVTGYGGTGSAGLEKYGIIVQHTAKITAAGSGNVIVDGYGGANAGGSNVGVLLYQGGSIQSTSGNVTVTGHGGGVSSSLAGVSLLDNGLITAGGTGNVVVTGYGGNGPASNHGVSLAANNSRITSSGGNVTVTGFGASNSTGSSSVGVRVDSNTSITAGGSGTVTVTGTGASGTGANNHGVLVLGSGAVITSSGGAVQVTGNSSSESTFGIQLTTAGQINDGGSGSLTLIANNISIDATATVTGTTTGTIQVRPSTNSLAIDLGGSDVLNATLGLSDAELDRFTAGTLAIGNSAAGAIAVSQPISHANALSITSGSTVSINDSITLSTNKNLVVNAASTIALTTTSADISVSGTGSLSLTSDRNIVLSNGSSIITANGNLTLTANQSTATSGNFIGVEVNGGLVRVTGNGSLSLLGKGGTDSGGFQSGVKLGGSVQVLGTGTLTVDGTGGTALGDRNYGVYLTGPTAGITSTSGVVTVTGRGGGSGTSSHNYGILSEAQATISSGASGTVTLNGFGGALTGSGVANRGVVLSQSAQVFAQHGNLQVNATGGGGNDGNSGLVVSGGADIYTSGTGNVNLNGTGGTTGNGAGSYGIHVAENGSTVSSVGGNVTALGMGGGAGFGGGNYGFYLENDADVSASSNGAITITGQGGNRLSTGTGSNNYGVYVVNSGTTISTNNGLVSINGTGGGGNTTSNNYGVFFTTSAQVSAGGTGQLLLVGQGGNVSGTSGNSNHGISLDGGATASTTNGDVTVDGTGGTGANDNTGVIIINGTLAAGGSGVLDVEGIGGSGTASYGIRSFGVMSSVTSPITLTGTSTGSGSFGIGLSTTGVINGSVTSTGAASITLVANNISLESNTSVTTSGSVTIRTKTNAQPIDIGASDTLNTTLGLADAELDRITAATLNIGAGSASTITISQPITQANAVVLSTTSSVTLNNSLSLSTNKNLTISATDFVSFAASAADVTLSGTGAVSITSSRSISLGSGSSIQTVNGNLTLLANQQTTPTTGNFVGVNLNNALVEVTGTGNLVLKGKGGNDTSGNQHGVWIQQGSDVIGGLSGTTEVDGTGGNSSGSFNFGTYITGAISSLTSHGGNVLVSGTGGGTGISTQNRGVYLSSPAWRKPASSALEAPVRLPSQEQGVLVQAAREL